MNEQDKAILDETYRLLEEAKKLRREIGVIMTHQHLKLYKLSCAEKDGWQVINDILDRNKPVTT